MYYLKFRERVYELQRRFMNHRLVFDNLRRDVDFVSEDNTETETPALQNSQGTLVSDKLKSRPEFSNTDFDLEKKRLLRKIQSLENDLRETELYHKRKLREISSSFFTTEELSEVSYVRMNENVKAIVNNLNLLKEKSTKLVKENESLELKTHEQSNYIETIHEKVSGLDLKIEILNQEKAQLSEENSKLRDINKKLEDQSVLNERKLEENRIDHNLKIRELEIKIDIYQNELWQREQIISTLKSHDNNIQLKLNNITKELQEKINIIEAMGKNQDTHITEISLLREKIISEEKSNHLLKEENQKIITLMEEQRTSLASFAKSLNRKNRELGDQIKILLEECESFELAHPLQDYFDFTTREIRRVELQLSKTPVVSIDRNQLEQSLQKLHDQNEVLNSVIKMRQIDLNQRKQKLTNLLIRLDAEQAPPPPPTLTFQRST